MRTKKILAIILCVTILVGVFTGCGNFNGKTSEDSKTEDNKTQEQFECGKKVYDCLNSVSDICDQLLSSIYNAWMFSTFDEAEDYYSTDSIMSAFAKKTKLDVMNIEEAYKSIGIKGSFDFTQYYIDDSTITVAVVMEAYKLNGKIGEIENFLSTAKSELKTMTDKYSDYSEYPNLKAYYSAVNSYAEFAKKPDCSFMQLQTTMEEYEKEIRTYKADLEFIFED